MQYAKRFQEFVRKAFQSEPRRFQVRPFSVALRRWVRRSLGAAERALEKSASKAYD